jgi:tRNA-modifying protein YgfZ
MNPWLTFLKAQGVPDHPSKPLSLSDSPYLMPMLEHQMLAVKGPDAAKFLQGQCTCDIRELEQQKILLGAHCNRQGRMISSFMVTNLSDQSIGLRLRQDIGESTLNSLKRYIVFSKASIELSPMVGFAILNFGKGTLPFDITPSVGQFLLSSGTLVAHHNSGLIEIWTNTDQAQAWWSVLAPQCQLMPPSIIDQHLIEVGVAEVQAATQEQFLPQDFNYQAIQAVNFKKGCYTGQEIVARMQYRGQLKKHCYRLTTNNPNSKPPLGTALFIEQAPDKKVAEVVASTYGQILVVSTEEIASSGLSLIDPQSQTNFSWAKLPYAIP